MIYQDQIILFGKKSFPFFSTNQCYFVNNESFVRFLILKKSFMTMFLFTETIYTQLSYLMFPLMSQLRI